MDRKQALEALLVKVEAGEWPDDYGAAPLLSHPSDCLALAAFEGSLDAAKALHEVLLPGWFANIWNQRPTALVAPSDDPDDDHKAHVSISSTPARAWLIAILKAYRAQVKP